MLTQFGVTSMDGAGLAAGPLTGMYATVTTADSFGPTYGIK